MSDLSIKLSQAAEFVRDMYADINPHLSVGLIIRAEGVVVGASWLSDPGEVLNVQKVCLWSDIESAIINIVVEQARKAVSELEAEWCKTKLFRQ